MEDGSPPRFLGRGEPATPASLRKLGASPVEHDHGNLSNPTGLLLVLRKTGPVALLPLPDRVPFPAHRDPRPRRKRLGAELDGHVGMGDDVVVPVRVGRGTALGGKDGDGVLGDGLVRDRVDPLGARLRAAVMQQEERSTREVAAHPPGVAAELVDDLLIPVGHCSGCRVARSSSIAVSTRRTRPSRSIARGSSWSFATIAFSEGGSSGGEAARTALARQSIAPMTSSEGSGSPSFGRQSAPARASATTAAARSGA